MGKGGDEQELSDGGNQKVFRSQRSQGDEVNPVREGLDGLGRGLEVEARLADASGAEQGEEAAGGGLEQAADLGQLFLPVQEGGRLRGKVGGTGLEGAQGREFPERKLGMREAEDLLGLHEVLEQMGPEVPKGRLG